VAINGKSIENSCQPAPSPEETGYECWLRYRPVSDPRSLTSYASTFGRLVAPGHSELLVSARRELVRGFGGLLGTWPELHVVAPPGGGHLAIGTTSQPAMGKALVATGNNPPRGDGFALVGNLPGPSAAVLGGSELGCLYGAFALLRRLQLGEGLPDRPIVEQPAMALRMLDHWDNLYGTVERGYACSSIFFRHGEVVAAPDRVVDYGRLLASVGINAVALNNVNVNREAMGLLTKQHLGRLAELAATFRAFGVRLSLCVGFASPVALGGLPSADPLDDEVRRWWAKTAGQVYACVPDLGGFVVKAGSESLPGPHDYGRDHSDGANVLAQALVPFGGLVIWRCLAYDCRQDWRDRSVDRAKAAYNEFFPLDGRFASNVALQVKAGPMDFQVREPASPLLGRTRHTRQLLEVQLTQEYTGQQVHLCYLVPAWKEFLDFRPHGAGSGEGPRVAEFVTGMAGVANIGDEQNWTGHHLAQAKRSSSTYTTAILKALVPPMNCLRSGGACPAGSTPPASPPSRTVSSDRSTTPVSGVTS
jgi:alpha-glucuronidase